MGDKRAQSFPEASPDVTFGLCFAIGRHLEEVCGPHRVGSHTVGSLLTDRPFTVDLNAKLILVNQKADFLDFQMI